MHFFIIPSYYKTPQISWDRCLHYLAVFTQSGNVANWPILKTHFHWNLTVLNFCVGLCCGTADRPSSLAWCPLASWMLASPCQPGLLWPVPFFCSITRSPLQDYKIMAWPGPGPFAHRFSSDCLIEDYCHWCANQFCHHEKKLLHLYVHIIWQTKPFTYLKSILH